jgi:hypothetical protein
LILLFVAFLVELRKKRCRRTTCIKGMKPERLVLINYFMVFLTTAALLTTRDSTILTTVTLLTIWNIPLLIENPRTLKLLTLKPKPPRQVKDALELLVELLREFFESAPLRAMHYP